jgi:DNA-binding LacI/PurR family transcriptional regulator
VLKAIAMLGDEPDAAARTLVTGRSRMIGIATYDTTFYGPASTLAAIERAAHRADYFTISVTTPSTASPDPPDFSRQTTNGIIRSISGQPPLNM